MNSNYKLPTDLENFIEVYGNRHRHLYFLAVRFKRSIIIYKPNSLDTIPIAPPPNSIIVIRGKCPPFLVQVPTTFLLFTDDPRVPGIPVSNNSTDALLRALVSQERILFSFFKFNVLYLITTENRFVRFMQKCRKDKAFAALCTFKEARLHNRSLTPTEVAELRFFKTPKENDLKHFNKWYYFAYDLCHESCYNTTLSHPSQKLGKDVFSILQRSDMLPGPLPPPDFYFCEIHLTHTGIMGFAFNISPHRDRELEYVSPMVLQQPKTEFRDSGLVICNTWLPLYRNRETWSTYGLKSYVYGLNYKKNLLKLILSWLQIQTSEKYRWIYLDLMQVARILFGEAVRSFTVAVPSTINKECAPVPCAIETS